MYSPISIEFKNLFSHEHTKYDFLSGKTVFIYGINSADEGQDSNGSGKSAIVEAITLAVTGEPYRDVDKEEFIHEDSNDCYISFILENKFLKHKFQVERWFYRGSKSAVIKITENGVLNKQLTSVPECNKKVFEYLGISKSDFLNYFVIGQGNNHSFFSASDIEKKEMISRFTNISVMNKVIDHISTECKRITKEHGDVVIEHKGVQSKIEQLQENIKEEEETWEEIVKTEIHELKAEVNERKELYKVKIDKLSLLRKEYKGALAEQRQIEEKLEKSKINEITKEISANKSKQISVKSSMEDLRKIELEWKFKLEHILTCPNCKHEFIIDSDDQETHTPEEIQEYIQNCKDNTDKKKLELSILKEEADKLEQKRSQLSELKNALELQIERVNDKKEAEEDLVEETARLLKNSEGFELKLKAKQELLKEGSPNIKKWRNDIALNSTKIQALDKKLADFQAELEKYSFWDYHFGKKGFSTFLANKSLKNIEGITNSYLKKFHTNLSVLINGFTVLKSGEVREKIDVFIQKDGISKGKYGRYSGGEKGRINLAGVLGLQKLINLSSNGRGLDLLALDEMFEGLDSTGQVEVSKILERVGNTILVISHMNKPLGCENEVFVIKERNTGSRITYNALETINKQAFK